MQNEFIWSTTNIARKGLSTMQINLPLSVCGSTSTGIFKDCFSNTSINKFEIIFDLARRSVIKMLRQTKPRETVKFVHEWKYYFWIYDINTLWSIVWLTPPSPYCSNWLQSVPMRHHQEFIFLCVCVLCFMFNIHPECLPFTYYPVD